MTAHPAGVALAAAIAVVLALGGGCGDNSETCGTGTLEVDGVCVAMAAPACGDGTKLEDGQCVIDPATCQSGTVLIANRCVDPTREPVVDLEESFEPNGLDVGGGERSTAPAGSIALSSLAATFVIHGHVTPFRDQGGDGQIDPDFDTYVLTASGPLILDISVDGVGGAQGSFFLQGPTALPTYERYGLNLSGDTAQRRLIVPSSGDYLLVITDTRSLAIGSNPPRPAGGGGAAGGPDAEYYVSITPVSIPVPSQIAASGDVLAHAGSLASDELQVFTAALGPGSYQVRSDMPGAAAASVAVLAGNRLMGYREEIPARMAAPAQPAETTVVLALGDVPVIFVDSVYNYGPRPEPFTLTVTRNP